MSTAQCAHLSQIARRRQDHPALTLDRFQDKSTNLPLDQGRFQSSNVTERNRITTLQQRFEGLAVLAATGH